MNIDFDRLKYSLTGEYEEVMLEKQLKEKDKEIERLNNIIDELEKFMDEDYEYYDKYGHAEQGHAMGQIRRIKNKLQELKHKKIYGSVDSEIVYFDELGSEKE